MGDRVAKPELQGLSRVQWELFCTFTFRSDRVPERLWTSMFFSLLRELARYEACHFSELVWCLRLESGERTGRFHLHALIAGLPAYRISPRSCRVLEATWRKLGGGWADVRVYSADLDAADYILKGLEQANESWTRQGANLYEFEKFGRAREITLSESLIRVVMGRRQLARRSRPGTAQRVVILPPATTQALDQRPSASTVRSGRQDYGAVNGKEQCASHIVWLRGHSAEQDPGLLPAVTSPEA